MNKISIDTLLQNAKRGGVSRGKYQQEVAGGMLDMRLWDMYSRLDKDLKKKEFSYRDAEGILSKFMLSPEVVDVIGYMDLMYLVNTCLESEDVNFQELALETVDYFLKYAYSVDKIRVQRRLPGC